MHGTVRCGACSVVTNGPYRVTPREKQSESESEAGAGAEGRGELAK
jgi:hypothetical protein